MAIIGNVQFYKQVYNQLKRLFHMLNRHVIQIEKP